MELTGIDDTNRAYFEPLLFLGGADPKEIQILAGVIDGGSPVAAAAFGVDKLRSTGRIVSIYTRPDMRRNKAGSMLMQSLFALAGYYHLSRMECFYTDGIVGMDPFLRAHGFETFGKRRAERYQVGSLLAMKSVRARLMKGGAVPVIDLKSATPIQKSTLIKKMKREDYGPLPEDTDEELSLIALEGGVPSAVILCSADEAPKPMVAVHLLLSFEESTLVVIDLLTEWLNVIVARFGSNATISFYATEPKVSSFLHSIAVPQPGQMMRYGEKDLP